MELRKIKGITEKREKDFNKLNIFSAEDLVRDFPRAYLDMSNRVSIRETYNNDIVLFACEVVKVLPVNFYSRLKTVRAYCSQDGFSFTAVWFNMPYVAQKLKAGEYLFYGRIQNKYGQISVVNPSFEELDKNYRLKGIVPVYSLKGSLTQKVVRDSIRSALPHCDLSSLIPEQIQKKYEIYPLERSFYDVHNPPSPERRDVAAERIALEEYFVLISAFKIIKGDKNAVRVNRYTVTAGEVKDFASRFGFEFTKGQKDAVNEIFENLHSPNQMNRLIQGDVGCGKTAVALCGIFMAVKSGYQAAYLSPTEVLAKQNFLLLQKIFPDYRVEFLSGSLTAKEKREAKARVKNGEADIVCGTHAVLQEDVEIPSLSFCVVDEQHRFGVAQRSSLSAKGVGVDVLVMSATPIPRTLALIFYGDLDVTTIAEKPHARKEISTSIVSSRKYDDMLEYIRRECSAGKQAYFVCSKIEDDEEGTVMSVTELYEELKARLPSLRFALLHGKLKDKEKNAIMQAFKDGEYDCLVSTTVIEVGVDVPNATIMVVYNAERFGLSQLHQLRGRVGRGAEQSYCFLLAGAETPTSVERLKIMKENTDGFKIAELDLAMRGSGDFLGTRQSGKMLTEIRNLHYSPDVIFLAKKLSDETFDGRFDSDELRKIAIQKYEKLKDVVLN